MANPADTLVDGSVQCNTCGSKIGQCACEIRIDDQPYATHSGVLRIGDLALRVHVLSNGQRIFEATDELLELMSALPADPEQA